MMNNKAEEIGCTNTHFVNCDGTHNENHYSTAHDMALIGKYAMQYDEIKNATSKTSYKLRATNMYDKEDRVYYTTNELILSGSENYYRYAKGIRTGFTTPAGYCLMSYSEKDDMPIVAVVMKSTTTDSRYDDAKKISNYAYENNLIRTIAEKGTNLQTIKVKNATNKTEKLNAILEEKLIAVVNVENKKTNIEPKIEIREKLKAPIQKGEIIGSVTYEIEGKVYKGNLIAESDVKNNHTLMKVILTFIGIIILLGTLRIVGLYRRAKVLKKIKGKK